MSKRKTWIKIKRGLLQPKHRLAIGECIWLYFHILDRANWKTGAVEQWKDEAEAEELEMSLRTLRHQRKKLEKAGYIKAEKRQHYQRIIIHKWINPRKYDGEVINIVGEAEKYPPQVGVLEEDQSDNGLVLSDNLGDESPNQSTNQSSNQVSTLPLDSQNHISHNRKDPPSLSQDNWVKALMVINLDYYQGRNRQFERDWNGTGYVGWQDGRFTVVCQDDDQRLWLQDHGKKIAENVLVGVLGERVEIEFVVEI